MIRVTSGPLIIAVVDTKYRIWHKKEFEYRVQQLVNNIGNKGRRA